MVTGDWRLVGRDFTLDSRKTQGVGREENPNAETQRALS
jgi:hypothetical protein